MPNWCSTSIRIYHKDHEKLKSLYDLINQWTSKEYTKSDFHNHWLGNIVLGSGVGTVDAGTETDLRCRGTLEDIILYDDCVDMCTETAWVPMLKMWQKLIDKYLPDAELFYTAEEPGCAVYYSNDPDYIGKYVIDCHDDLPEDCDVIEPYAWEIYNKEDTIEILQELLKTKEESIENLLDEFEDSEFAEKIAINQYEEYPIEELG